MKYVLLSRFPFTLLWTKIVCAFFRYFEYEAQPSAFFLIILVKKKIKHTVNWSYNIFGIVKGMGSFKPAGGGEGGGFRSDKAIYYWVKTKYLEDGQIAAVKNGFRT
jgi:hypothetical protein